MNNNNDERNRDRDIRLGLSMSQTKYLPLKGKIQKVLDSFDPTINGVNEIHLIPGAEYNLSDISNNGETIFIDMDNVIIYGNNAWIINDQNYKNGGMFFISGNNITVKDLNLRGLKKGDSAVNQEHNSKNSGINIYGNYGTNILNCKFSNFTGYGITGSAHTTVYDIPYDYFKTDCSISNNFFERCAVGFAALYFFEYGRADNNNFYECLVGIIDSAGNWTYNGTKINSTNIPLLSSSLNFELLQWDRKRGKQLGLKAGNWCHGQFTGLQANHSLDANRVLWTENIKVKLLGGTFKDLTADNGWSVIGSVIPPQMTNITLWYSGIKFYDLTATITPYKIVNVVASGRNIAGKNGGLMADTPNTIDVIGYTKWDNYVMNYNITVLGTT